MNGKIALVAAMHVFLGTLLGWVGWVAPTPVMADQGMSVRWATGQVVAVNTKDTPNVIVISATTAKNEELIVGATVGGQVPVTRGKQAVTLQEIQVGESVTLKYVKTLEGLEARSIHVR